jgi:hypothetical protein
MFSTKIVLHDDKVEFSSLSFSENVHFTEITKMNFYEQVPTGYQPEWRMNGIGLFGYLTGKFKTDSDEIIYVQTTTSPYIIITAGNKPKILASADESLYLTLQKRIKNGKKHMQPANKSASH